MLLPIDVRLSEKLQHSVMKFDRSNKIFNLTYVTVGKQIDFG